MNQNILVVKTGGGKDNTFEFIINDLAQLWHQGRRWVYMHGGSERTNEISKQLNHPPEFVETNSGFVSRRTDRKTMEIFTMVYAGEINKLMVEALQKKGVNAIGLSGADGRILEGKRKAVIRVKKDGKSLILRDDYTGSIKSVNSRLLLNLIEQGYAPVLCPPAISLENELINVDGDRAAAAVANGVGAKELVLLTGAPGLLKDAKDKTSVLKKVFYDEIDEAIKKYAEGRMRIKLLAVSEALNGGRVKRVIISDSNIEYPLREALLGAGTEFIKRE